MLPPVGPKLVLGLCTKDIFLDIIPWHIKLLWFIILENDGTFLCQSRPKCWHL